MASVRIDLNALRSNYRALKKLAPRSKTLAVVKANAYGHGLFETANALASIMHNDNDEVSNAASDGKSQGLDGFAVARIEEAIYLRNKGFTQTIVLLEGVLTAHELESAYQNNISLVLHNFHQCELLNGIEWQENKSLCLWIKVNTGMNRLGFSVNDLPALNEQLDQFKNLSLDVLMTHLANADSDKEADQEKALQQFEKAKAVFPQVKEYSIANSAAILCYPRTHTHWNRPGIALYGATTLLNSSIQPAKQQLLQQTLRSVMQFSAPVIAINEVKKGESVGYGATWTAAKNTRVAVIGAGYGDGYPRHAKQGTPVSLSGKTYPLIGRVSMDMITVDISDSDQTMNIGDQAILWGDSTLGVGADTIAEYADTISYELFCGISPRVKREYKNSSIE